MITQLLIAILYTYIGGVDSTSYCIVDSRGMAGWPHARVGTILGPRDRSHIYFIVRICLATTCLRTWWCCNVLIPFFYWTAGDGVHECWHCGGNCSSNRYTFWIGFKSPMETWNLKTSNISSNQCIDWSVANTHKKVRRPRDPCYSNTPLSSRLSRQEIRSSFVHRALFNLCLGLDDNRVILWFGANRWRAQSSYYWTASQP